MNFDAWYTDLVDVYRVVDKQRGALTKRERELVYRNIPCRVYQESGGSPTMRQDAGFVSQSSKIALSNDYLIKPGDELQIVRGGRLGHTHIKVRAFAGDARNHFEPFGSVMPRLDHQEIDLLQQEYM